MGEQADYEIERMLDRHMFVGKPSTRQLRKNGPPCPSCGRKPKLSNTQYGWRRDCCGLWGWGKTAPLVDRDTHQARSYAHKVFDSLWQSGLVGRSRAYALLAAELDLDPTDCHMKLMDRETADRVPGAVHTISKHLRGIPT